MEQKQMNADLMTSEEIGILLAEQYKLLIQTQFNINVLENTLILRKENKKDKEYGR